MTRVEADIKAVLIAPTSGLGLSTSDVRYDSWDEDHSIVIVAGGGNGIISSTSTLQKPLVQIQVRSTDDTGTAISAAKTLIWNIIKLFHQNEAITGCVGAVWNLREPDRWVDENGRTIYAAEFNVWKEL